MTHPLGLYRVAGHGFVHRPDSYDAYVIDEVWRRDDYFLEHVSPRAGGVIIDIGAHIGAFSVLASTRYPTNDVVAIEPVSANFRLLRHNVARNHCRRVSLIAAAVRASPGETVIYLDSSNTAGHSAVIPSGHEVRVRSIPFGALVEEYVDRGVALLKIDCEGGEYELILETPAAVWQSVDHLTLEYHPISGHDFAELDATLRERGMRLIARRDGHFAGQGTALYRRMSLV